MRKNLIGIKASVFYLLLGLGFIVFLSSCAKKEEKAGITIWHWMTDRENAFIELAEEYENKTGTKINFELYAPSGAYTNKIMAAAQTNTLPDIYGILGETRSFASFIKSGYVVDLTEHMNENGGQWKKKLFKKAIAVNEFLPENEFGVKPGIYGVPIDVMNIQMLYNKSLFKKAGLDPEKPPRRWKEFLAYGKKLKDAGIQGFVSGWGEIWLIDCLANNYAYNIMGKEKILATIRGKVPYTDKDWIRVFKLFEEMRNAGILTRGIVTMVNKKAEQVFSNQQAAFAFNGSWCVNVYAEMNPNLNYGAMLPPKVSDKYPLRIWGGAGSSFMVNTKSKNKEESIKFLKWLTDKEQQIFLAQKTRNLPSNKSSLANIPSILAEFADDMDVTTHPNTLPVAEFPIVIEAFDKGIQSIIIGEKTPEEVAKKVQAIKLRELKRKKRES
ncbi:extracellular solute-binding protein [bacterium]|nr:extracellular solute-binding protein [bacterium]